MSEVKDFHRTMREAEQRIKDHLAAVKQKESHSEIFFSCQHLEIILDNLLENLTTDTIKERKDEIENIYYHIGKIKGCL